MDLLERAIFLLIGIGIGFVLGVIVANLREIKEELDVVEHIVKNDLPEKGDRGAIRLPSFSSFAVLVVVLLTAYAAIAASVTNHALNKTVECLTRYNTDQGVALDTRDEAIKDETQSEIDLWTLYEKLYKIAESDPKKIPIVQDRLNKAIGDYRNELIDTQATRESNEYADPDVLRNCEEKE